MRRVTLLVSLAVLMLLGTNSARADIIYSFASTTAAPGFGAMSGFVYTINDANVRATTGVPTGWTLAANCWVLKKDGSC